MMAGRVQSQVPVQYFDYLILAPTGSQEDDIKADDLRIAVDESKILREANGGVPCKVELIEEASGETSDFLSLVDKGINLTTAVLAIITEQYCQGRDEEAIAKFVLILSDRIQGMGRDKVQLIPVYMPDRLSDSAYRKLPTYIRALHSYVFNPSDGTISNRFFKKLAAMMVKIPFQNRKKAIIGRLRLEEAKLKLTEKTQSFELDLEEYKNRTKHMQEMRKLDEEMRRLQVQNLPNAALVKKAVPSPTERHPSVSMPPMYLHGPGSCDVSVPAGSSSSNTSNMSLTHATGTGSPVTNSMEVPSSEGTTTVLAATSRRVENEHRTLQGHSASGTLTSRSADVSNEGPGSLTHGHGQAMSVVPTARVHVGSGLESSGERLQRLLPQPSTAPTLPAAMRPAETNGVSQLSAEGAVLSQSVASGERTESYESQSEQSMNESRNDSVPMFPNVFQTSTSTTSSGDSESRDNSVPMFPNVFQTSASTTSSGNPEAAGSNTLPKSTRTAETESQRNIPDTQAPLYLPTCPDDNVVGDAGNLGSPSRVEVPRASSSHQTADTQTGRVTDGGKGKLVVDSAGCSGHVSDVGTETASLPDTNVTVTESSISYKSITDAHTGE